MRGFRRRHAAAGLIALLLSGSASAQVSNLSTYDQSRRIDLQGTVTRVEWVNPSAFIFVNVRDAAGIVTNWAVEVGEAVDLERNGWKRDALRLGDVVAVQGVPAIGQVNQALASTVTLPRSGERLFTTPNSAAAALTPAPAPRGPDGRVRLGPPTGRKGYWGAASVKAFVEDAGASIPMNEDGLLVNLSDADRVAPFKPWAKALYLYRQRNLLQDDPIRQCLPPGGPRQFQMPNGFEFIEQPELGRILVLMGGGNRNWRVIHTDGRPQTPSAELVLTYYGNSVGRWEGDTLVVDSAGFNEKFWLTGGGLPHTEALHLVERFSRPDLNTLRYEVTVDDPGAYTRPWRAAWTIQWVADREIQEYFCEDNAESSFIR